MIILIFMCGEGLGHTSRCLALGQELLSFGHEVYFGAYGYSKAFIEHKGYNVHNIPSEMTLIGNSGVFDRKASMKASMKNPLFFGKSIVSKLITKVKPEIVISDTYMLGVFAAKAMKLPTYLIVNHSKLEESFTNCGVSIAIMGKLTQKLYNSAFEKADKIIIPDYPLPFTVCRRNLDFTAKVREKIFYSGPLVRKIYEEIEEIPMDCPHILSLIGGFGYRDPIFRNVLKTARLDPSINYTLFPGPNLQPDKFTDLPENVQLLKFIDNPLLYFKNSDAIIVPGGHSTIMEALSFGVPILSVPDEGQLEQENNAIVIEEEGYGKRLGHSTPPKVILECIRIVIEDEQYRKKAERLRRLAKELNGPKAIREMLEEEVGKKEP